MILKTQSQVESGKGTPMISRSGIGTIQYYKMFQRRDDPKLLSRIPDEEELVNNAIAIVSNKHLFPSNDEYQLLN